MIACAVLRRLDRYLIQEIAGPLGLGFLVYTFMLLLRALFRFAELIIRRGLPVSTVGELLLFSLPNIVVLTIPMALLFGILIAIGRLSSDSELVAMRSTGISLLSLYRPILVVSGLLAAINAALMVWVLPWGNQQLQLKQLDIATQGISAEVEPRIFYDEFDEWVLYVDDIPEGDDRWHGVFLAQAIPSTQDNQVILADYGRVAIDDQGEKVVLQLEGARIHQMDLAQPERYEVSYNKRIDYVLEDQFMTEQRAKISESKSVRELDLEGLQGWARNPALPESTRRAARVEIHKKFAIPFACIVFGIFALPLGFNNRRGGKGAGFALSILVIIVYWVMLDTGENYGKSGRLPVWLAIWAPNLVLAALGLFLLARKNRDKSLLLSRFDRYLRQVVQPQIRSLKAKRDERIEGRRAARERAALEQASRREHEGRPQVVIRLPRFQLRFPNILDRYVIRTFLGILGMVVTSGLTIYIVADLTQIADDIFENDVSRSVVFSYYKYMSLQIVYELAPILVLITTLITFSVLSRNSEVIAIKALGVSLYRLALPAVALALLVTLGTMFMESNILPASNERVNELEAQIKGREEPRSYRRADRQWLFARGRYIYNYLHYDTTRQQIQRLQVFEMGDGFSLDGRLLAQRAEYATGGSWYFENGWARRFEGSGVTSYDRFEGSRLVQFPENPDFFESELRPPEQMSYSELDRYIEELEASGQAAPALEVELQNKIAYPFISLVMALVALPFAFRLGRQGALYGIGLSIVIGIVFIAIYAFFTTMGQTGRLPPLVAVWSPNVVFAMLSVYLFLGVRS